MATPTPFASCNAGIFLEEDDPSGSNYNTLAARIETRCNTAPTPRSIFSTSAG